MKEQDALRKRALKYLDLAQKKMPEYIEKLNEILPPLVSKMDLHPTLKNQVYRSHQIRTLLTNTYREEDDSGIYSEKDLVSLKQQSARYEKRDKLG